MVAVQEPMLVPPNGVEIPLRADAFVHVLREPRHRCPTCLMRRVLYRIEIAPLAKTGAQCALCWGMGPS